MINSIVTIAVNGVNDRYYKNINSMYIPYYGTYTHVNTPVYAYIKILRKFAFTAFTTQKDGIWLAILITWYATRKYPRKV